MLVSGDSTLIQTPSRKNILIDTGEEENTIVEYLLDRKIKKIDYLMISHFDSDHSAKAAELIEKLKVKYLIISKQTETSEQFEKTIEIAQKRKVKIITVEAGNVLKIDKDTNFQILWPKTKKTISENPLNNNSIVAKFNYKNFSMLFTGDIEEIAEKSILQEYENSNILESTILKVAHHGSNTSSIEQFIEKVKPKIALIGVGKENKFGHPKEEVIERLEKVGCKIYRTDLSGEIEIKVKKNTIEFVTKKQLKIKNF